jgi:hypothetical protein
MPRRREGRTNYRRKPYGYQAGPEEEGRSQCSLPRYEEEGINPGQRGTSSRPLRLLRPSSSEAERALLGGVVIGLE